MTNIPLEKYNSFILDMDGTIYRGNMPIKFAKETINKLKASGKKIIFITNKTTETAEDYYNFLKEYGFNINQEEIITASMVLRKYLVENFNYEYFLLLGEHKFKVEIENEGFIHSEDPERIKIIIVSLAHKYDKDLVKIAVQSLKKGARFFAANIDSTCPEEDCEISDAGSLIPKLENLSGRRLELHFGKPSIFMINEIKKLFNGQMNKSLVIGDRLETDIRMANLLSVDSALVGSGIRNDFLLYRSIKPTYKLETIADLFNFNTNQ